MPVTAPSCTRSVGSDHAGSALQHSTWAPSGSPVSGKTWSHVNEVDAEPLEVEAGPAQLGVAGVLGSHLDGDPDWSGFHVATGSPTVRG